MGGLIFSIHSHIRTGPGVGRFSTVRHQLLGWYFLTGIDAGRSIPEESGNGNNNNYFMIHTSLLRYQSEPDVLNMVLTKILSSVIEDQHGLNSRYSLETRRV